MTLASIAALVYRSEGSAGGTNQSGVVVWRLLRWLMMGSRLAWQTWEVLRCSHLGRSYQVAGTAFVVVGSVAIFWVVDFPVSISQARFVDVGFVHVHFPAFSQDLCTSHAIDSLVTMSWFFSACLPSHVSSTKLSIPSYQACLQAAPSPSFAFEAITAPNQ